MSSTDDKIDLDELLAYLEDSDQISEISERLDKSLRNFQINEIDSHATFNNELKRFIRHIYNTGLLVSQELTPESAFAEAIYLLDRYYSDGNGYYEAYLDVMEKEGKGIEYILQFLTSTIREREIMRIENWRYTNMFDPCDSEKHLKIVSEILDRFGQYLPERIVTSNPARFIRQYRQLLEMIISVKNLISRIRSSQDFSLS